MTVVGPLVDSVGKPECSGEFLKVMRRRDMLKFGERGPVSFTIGRMMLVLKGGLRASYVLGRKMGSRSRRSKRAQKCKPDEIGLERKVEEEIKELLLLPRIGTTTIVGKSSRVPCPTFELR